MYSQHDEEEIIGSFFAGHVGRFLDVGAYDGRTFSNTHALALAGWGGVCVEAAPQSFAKLQALYAERPDVVCVHAAVTEEVDGCIELWETPDALSTTEEAHRAKWAGYTHFDQVVVPALSVASLMSAHPGPFDLVSVDTEGTSVSLALQLATLLPLVRLMCVEHDGCVDGIEAALALRGMHRLALNGENLLMGRP